MQIKEVIKGIIEKMPMGFQNQIYLTQSKLNKKKVLEKWENAGKPVPPPSLIKQSIVRDLKEKYNCTILVETGTYLGDMLISQRNNFQKIYSIELSDFLWEKAKKRLAMYPNIELLQGDSGKVLNEVIPRLDAKTLFWLDGHFSSGITAKGDIECPIYEELDAIFRGKDYQHLILIDDARLFNGTSDYPTIDELKKYIFSKNANYKVEITDDIIRCSI